MMEKKDEIDKPRYKSGILRNSLRILGDFMVGRFILNNMITVFLWSGWAKKPKLLIKQNNQSPKGIMRSAVTMPCFFDIVKSQ